MVTPDLSLDAAAALPADLEHHDTHGSRPRLHYIAAGAGPPVLSLHGFPDFWFGWRHQLRPLTAAGYRVVAPDQRGYNRSDKPRVVYAYRLDALADDVLRRADAVAPGQPIALVKHDWGGVVAWWIALRHPERLSRLVIINAPHSEALRSNTRRVLAQMRRSWYIAFFQTPWLPEWLLSRNEFWGLERALCASSHVGAFLERDLIRSRRAALHAQLVSCPAPSPGAPVAFPRERADLDPLGEQDVAQFVTPFLGSAMPRRS